MAKRPYAPRLPPAERREQLLDAALAVLDNRGYGGVSMEAIARAAGVTKPVVYDLFGNRGELLTALLVREEERTLAQIAEAMPIDPQADPDQLALESFRVFLDSVRATPASWRLILLPAEGTPELVREHVERGRRIVRERLEQVIAAGVEARGGDPADLDLELAAQALIAVAEHFARMVLSQPRTYPPDRIAEFVAGLLGALQPSR